MSTTLLSALFLLENGELHRHITDLMGPDQP